jgi:uncharacterized cupredoxin-like copper-binding protein
VRVLIATSVILAGLLVAACGDDDEGDSGATATPGGTPAGGGAEVDVTLQDFSVIPDADSAVAGEISFNVENIGPDHMHELVIVKTDLEPDALPTLDDGSMDETGEGVEVIDEIEEFSVGETQSITVDLEAGSYALICNVVHHEEGETFVHYELGMRTGFTLE